MQLGRQGGRIVVMDEPRRRWVVVRDADDLPSLLGREDWRGLVERSLADGVLGEAPDGLPFAQQSLRAFALWEAHMVNGARGMVRRFAPPALRRLAGAYERATGRVLPPLRPKSNYRKYPQFYVGNHRSLVPDGATVRWPAFSGVLDFELEIGVVIGRPVRDCTAEEGRRAIAGLCIVNDWSARDTQWDDTSNGTFGGVVKAKTFAGAMSAVVVSADEILPRWQSLRGRAAVNGEVWCEGATAGPTFDLGEAVAYAAMGETLLPGDLLSTGTLPGCCGLEIGRFIAPGDTVRLEIDGLGSLTNTVSQRGA